MKKIGFGGTSALIMLAALACALSSSQQLTNASVEPKGNSEFNFEFDNDGNNTLRDNRAVLSFVCRTWRDTNTIKDFFFTQIDIQSDDGKAKLSQVSGAQTKDGFRITLGLDSVGKSKKLDVKLQVKLRIRGNVGVSTNYDMKGCLTRQGELGQWKCCDGDCPTASQIHPE